VAELRLAIGVSQYPWEHALKTAVIRGRKAGRDLPLRLVALADMRKMHDVLPNTRALPQVIAYDVAKLRLWFHPVPDGEYWVDLEPAEVPSAAAVRP